jgi:ASC-1-like (ASCH) protein
LPPFRTKKEAFDWLSSGEKTIDVRKGKPFRGEVAVYLSGQRVLRLKIAKTETGILRSIIRADNFKLIIPSALNSEEAIAYFHKLYGQCNDGFFTAYYVNKT